MTSSNLQTWLNFCSLRRREINLLTDNRQKLLSAWKYYGYVTDSPQLLLPQSAPLSMKNPHPQQLQKLQNQSAKPGGGQKVNSELKSPFEPSWTKALPVPRWATKPCPVGLHPELSEQHGKEESLFQPKGVSWAVSGVCVHTLYVCCINTTTFPVPCQVQAALSGKTGMEVCLFLCNNTTKESHSCVVVLSHSLMQPYIVFRKMSSSWRSSEAH